MAGYLQAIYPKGLQRVYTCNGNGRSVVDDFQ